MKAKRTKLTDQLRQAIEGGPKSRYQIAKETGIDNATLCRFVQGKGGLSMDGLDLIAECLGLNLTTERPAPKAKRAKTKSE
jgi:transcriptional regulator with XRE-family HTH domain